MGQMDILIQIYFNINFFRHVLFHQISKSVQIKNIFINLFQMIAKARQVLVKVDMFGQNINLNLDGQDLYRTSFGGLLSVFLLFVVAIFFQSNIITFFQRTNIVAEVEQIFSEDPDSIILNDDNFMFALSIEQTNFTISPLFNITLKTRVYENHDNGTKSRTEKFLNLIPCTLDRFQKLFTKYDKDYTKQFNELSLSTWLCPDYGYEIILGGRFTSKRFEHVKIEITDCRNTAGKNQTLTWRPVCASEEIKQQRLKANGQFRVQFYVTNTLINLDKPTNTTQLFFDEEQFFAFIPQKMMRQSDIFFTKYHINTDHSLLPVLKQEEHENIIQKTEFRDIVQLAQEQDTIHTALYMRRSPFTFEAKRRFLKADELLSYLGGFVNIVVVVLGMAVAFYNKQQYLFELANKVYDFSYKQTEEERVQIEQNAKLASKLQALKRKTQRLNSNVCQTVPDNNDIGENQEGFFKTGRGNLSPSVTRKQLRHASTIQRNDLERDLKQQSQKLVQDLGFKSRKDYLTSQFVTLLNRGKPIYLSIRFVISKLSFGRLFQDEACILLDKAIQKISEDLDIYVIIEKLKQIDLLKELFMDKDQQILFNFAPKEVITLKSQKNIPSRVDVNRNQTETMSVADLSQILLKKKDKRFMNPSLRVYYKVFKAYDRLFREENRQNPLNDVLAEKLGPEIKDIFQVSQFIDFDLYKEKVTPRMREVLRQRLKRARQKLQKKTQSLFNDDGGFENLEMISLERCLSDEENVLKRELDFRGLQK